MDLYIDGTTERIRLIGIDTPESVHPTKGVECFGIEASNKAKQLTENQFVAFENDASQDTRDRYGRLLGYIFLPNGDNFNKRMIEEGYAYEYTYSRAYKYRDEFKDAENYARINKLGLWNPNACPLEQKTEDASDGNSTFYVSSHYSAKYYYCEKSDGWKGLSEKYLKTYTSEKNLLEDFPNHTLHESCN